MKEIKTLHDIAEIYQISMRKLIRMQKSGLLNITDDAPEIRTRMIYHLKKRQPLTVEFFLTLLRDPDAVKCLGDYAAAARKQIKALGDIAGEAISGDFATALIYGLHINDPDSLERGKKWALDVIPAEGCGYHYLAVRLLFNVPEKRFKESYAFIGRAVTNLRRYAPEIDGGKANGQRFKNPAKISFDL